MQVVKDGKIKDLIYKLEKCKSPDELRKIVIDLAKHVDSASSTNVALSKELKKSNERIDDLEKDIKKLQKLPNLKQTLRIK